MPDEVREQLRAAIGARAEAHDRVAASNRSAATVQTALQEAEDAAAAFAGLDKDLASYHVQQARAALDAGQPVPPMATPDHLAGRMTERDAATRRVAVLRAVALATEGERAAALADHAGAVQHTGDLAKQVALADGLALLAETLDHERRAAVARGHLAGLVRALGLGPSRLTAALAEMPENALEPQTLAARIAPPVVVPPLVRPFAGPPATHAQADQLNNALVLHEMRAKQMRESSAGALWSRFITALTTDPAALPPWHEEPSEPDDPPALATVAA